MSSRRIAIGTAAVLAGAAGFSLIGAAPALAARSTQQLDCGDAGTLTLLTNNNNSSDMGGWSAAQVVGGGHLIPVEFDFTVYDVTAGQWLVAPGDADGLKGAGNDNHNQGPTITCTETQAGLLSDFVQPGDQLPGWASLTDTIQFTITATAIDKR